MFPKNERLLTHPSELKASMDVPSSGTENADAPFPKVYERAQRAIGDERRLAAVNATGLLDSEVEESFDRLTRLAVRLIKIPAAFVSLVDKDRDFYKSACGFGEPLASSRQLEGPTFCHFTIQSAEPLVIPDTRADPVYRDVPTVQSLGVAAYVGIPIVINGQVIGAFCAIDTVLHPWTDFEITALKELAAVAVSEITLRATRAEVERERHRLRDVFMQAPAAIAVTEGPRHVFIVVNPLFAQMMGKRELLGKPAREAFPELHLQPIEDIRDQVYVSGVPYVGREVFAPLDRAGDGVFEDAYFDFVFQPLTGDDGRVFGMMIHAVEVTDKVIARRLVEAKAEELTRLTGALERSNRELDRFAYVASHDLKAPLRGIASLAAWIGDDVGDALPPASRDHLQLMHKRVQRMEALIDGILTYARTGRTHTKPEPVDIGRLVQEVIELLSPPTNVVIDIQPNFPTVAAERVPLQQVFMNLISNAIKHGSTAAPRVEIAWRRADTAFEFSVRDNGPGIAPEFHDRIWTLFQTLEARDKVEGTGIGLAVVKKIVESNGGNAWVESSPGAGATFRFTWPRATV